MRRTIRSKRIAGIVTGIDRQGFTRREVTGGRRHRRLRADVGRAIGFHEPFHAEGSLHDAAARADPPPHTGDLTFAHAAAFVDDVVTVGEQAIADAGRRLAARAKLVAAPGGAASVAAVLFSDRGTGGADGDAVAVLSSRSPPSDAAISEPPGRRGSRP